MINIGVRDAMKASSLNKETRHHARSCMEHPQHPKPWLFGLSVVLESLAMYHPRTLGDWLASDLPTSIDLTALKYLGERVMFASPVAKIHRGLIRTKRPLLQAIAARTLAHGGFHKRRVPFREILELGHECGLTHEQSFSLALAAVDSACVQKPQALGKLKQTEERLRLLKEKPDQAIGGVKQAAAETERLNSDLAKLSGEADSAVAVHAQLMDDVVSAWTDSISSEQIADLRDALGRDRDVLSVELAEKLKDHLSARALLDPVIDAASDFLGLEKPSESFKHAFLHQPAQFNAIVRSFPPAVSLRYADDKKKGPEHRTGLLLDPLMRAAYSLIERPYAAQRWPSEYESALNRCAAAVLLALYVAEACSPAAMQSSTLAQHAISHAIKVFERDRSDIVSQPWVDRLGLKCVQLMANKQLADRRSEWAKNTKFPPFIRAISLWSDFPLMVADSRHAVSLFQAALLPPASAWTDRLCFRALNLLDVAFSTMGRSGNASVARELVSIWPTVYSYLAHLDKYDVMSAPDLLMDALDGQPKAHETLLHSQTWHESLFAAFIRKSRNEHPCESE